MNVILSGGGVSINMITFLDYILRFLCFTVFSFVLWKKLKDDYTHDLIFSFTLISLFVAAFGVILAGNFLPGFSFWFVFLLQLICVTWFVKREYFKFYELVDAFSIAWLAFFLLSNISDLVMQIIKDKGIRILDLHFVLHVVLIGFVFLLYKTILKKYRSFSWYPSGKIGFLGFAVLTLYFLFRSLVAIVISGVLPFFEIQGLPSWDASRIADSILSFCLFLVFGFWIYVRSGRGGGTKIANKLSSFSEALEKIFIWQRK